MTGKTSDHSTDSTAAPAARRTATARIAVGNSDTRPYGESAGPVLAVLSLDETFSGDWEGESAVRALQVLRDDGSATMVSLQRVRGTLGGRRGSFVLEGRERIEGKAISATWSVVPGSGTDALAGLRGEGGFEGEFGKGSVGTLDYWFEAPVFGGAADRGRSNQDG